MARVLLQLKTREALLGDVKSVKVCNLLYVFGSKLMSASMYGLTIFKDVAFAPRT